MHTNLHVRRREQSDVSHSIVRVAAQDMISADGTDYLVTRDLGESGLAILY